MAKQALGRGLGALISTQTGESATSRNGTAEPPSAQVQHIALDCIVPSPLQPRAHFSESPLEDLVESIRQHGIIQPLITRYVDGKYELIAGERRWRACQILGLATAPVIVRTASDRDVLEMALIENLQRENLNPIEEATGFVRLAREFGLKQEEIAARVGKKRATVANAMRLLDLHPEVQGYIAKSRLSVGHGKAILSLRDHHSQLFVAEQIMRKSLTVRATEKMVHNLLHSGSSSTGGESRPAPAAAPSSRGGDPHVQALANRLRSYLSTNVVIIHSAKKGRIEIEYYGLEELERILELLKLQPSEL